MPSKVTIPNTFAAATTAIPLSQLDANFSNVNAAINNALTFSNYAVDAGTANNYSITITGQTTTYAAGLAFQFLAANANSGASTLNVNGQGAKSIIKSTGGALTAGDISAGAIISVMYDGTNFQLLNDTASGSETFTNITVTGTATINTANVTTFSPAITNAQLANSAITIGNTAVSLGGTITTINNATLVNANVSSGTVSVSSITDSGNLTFTGTGNRITGDFSNATAANRVAFQTSTSNSATVVNIIPNGTSRVTSLNVMNSSDPDNSGFGQLRSSDTEIRLTAGAIGTGSNLPMTFYTGGSERMRIDTSGNVGIGVTPSAFTSGFRALQVGARSTILYRDDITSTEILNNAVNNSGYLYQATAAAALYRQRDGQHSWFTAASGTAGNTITFTQAMTLDASGNVGIGTSSPGNLLTVKPSSSGTPVLIGDAAVNSTLAVTRITTAPSFVAISATSSAGNLIGGPALTFQSSTDSGASQTERMRMDSSGNFGIGRTPSYLLDVNGTARFNTTIGVGNTAPSSSGAGITFPATQSASTDANTLDDYEEGTWTPTFTGSISDPTVTYATQVGQYTKIGRVVHVQCNLYPSAYSGGSGTVRISGLPFTSNAGNFYALGSAYLDGVNIATGRTWAVTYVQPNAAFIRLLSCQNNAAATDVNVSDISANDNLILSITYMV